MLLVHGIETFIVIKVNYETRRNKYVTRVIGVESKLSTNSYDLFTVFKHQEVLVRFWCACIRLILFVLLKLDLY